MVTDKELKMAIRVLGFSNDTILTFDVLRHTYRELSRKWHPDMQGVGDEAKFKRLVEARQLVETVLRNGYKGKSVVGVKVGSLFEVVVKPIKYTLINFFTVGRLEV